MHRKQALFQENLLNDDNVYSVGINYFMTWVVECIRIFLLLLEKLHNSKAVAVGNWVLLFEWRNVRHVCHIYF